MPGSSVTEPHRRQRIAVAIALIVASFVAAALCLPYPGMAADEGIYLSQAKWYVYSLQTLGFHALSRPNVDRIFRGSSEHPPLGRLIIGGVHWLGDAEPGLPGYVDRLAGRFAGAACYALLVGAVYLLMAWQVGTAGALAAAGMTALSPRLFGHAQLISLDVIAATFWFVALACAVWAFAAPSRARAAVAGVVCGLALLVKMQAVLLPVVLIPWAFWRHGRKALVPTAIWSAVALAVFLLGWPWIWYDTWHRLSVYLASGVHRAHIFVTYFGHKYADTDVPWTYPLVMTGVTVPLTTLVPALVGAVWVAVRRHPLGVLVLGAAVSQWVLFAIPGVPVYDGTRHFLAVFPLVACLAGLAVQWGWELARASARRRWMLATAAGILTLLPVWHLYTYFPFHLSYYNRLVGGLPGAERLGLEVTYWGEGVDEPLLRYVAQHADVEDRVAIAPLLLDPLRAVYAARTDFADKRLKVVPFVPGRCHWLIVFPRRAYLDDAVRHILDSGPPVLTRQVHGVSVARVYRLTPTR